MKSPLHHKFVTQFSPQVIPVLFSHAQEGRREEGQSKGSRGPAPAMAPGTKQLARSDEELGQVRPADTDCSQGGSSYQRNFQNKNENWKI